VKVLMTGVTGFIGRWMVEEALRRGWAVTALVRPGRGAPLRRLERDGADIRVLGLCPHAWQEGLRSATFDVAVNLVGPGRDSWVTNWRANVEYVRQLSDFLSQRVVGRVVHFSSVAVYGTSAREKGAVIREDDRLAPDDWYGVTKVLGERTWRAFHGKTGIPVTILRPSWVIGRGSRLLDRHLVAAARAGLLVRMLPRAPFNGIFVRDVVRAALMAIDNESGGFRVYNVNAAAGEFGEFIEALRSEVPRAKIPLWLPEVAVRALAWRFGSLRFFLSGVRIDATKAMRELRFIPQYSAKSLVRELICSYAGDTVSPVSFGSEVSPE